MYFLSYIIPKLLAERDFEMFLVWSHSKEDLDLSFKYN